MNIIAIQSKMRCYAVMLLISITCIVFGQGKIAIIDAGSSGSRLHVYKVSINDNKEIVVENLMPQNQSNSKDEIGPFATDGSCKKAETLAQNIAKQYLLAKSDHGDLPLYVLATAGMRMVLNKTEHDEFYKTLEATLKEKGIQNEIHAMTISGRFEGFYAWLAANAKEEILTYDKKNG